MQEKKEKIYAGNNKSLLSVSTIKINNKEIRSKTLSLACMRLFSPLHTQNDDDFGDFNRLVYVMHSGLGNTHISFEYSGCRLFTDCIIK